MCLDSEFELACKELYEPQTEGWEIFVETHGVTIYRLYNEVIRAEPHKRLWTMHWYRSNAKDQDSVVTVPPGGWGGGGYSDMFIRRLGSFFRGFKN